MKTKKTKRVKAGKVTQVEVVYPKAKKVKPIIVEPVYPKVRKAPKGK